MRRFLRFLWDDSLAYLSASAALVGVIVVLFPVQGLPGSYGLWVVVVAGIILAYRIAKSSLLLCFGLHTNADVVEKYVGFRNVAKIHYSFETRTGTVLSNCEAFDQDRKLMVAYLESYPSFHVVYWDSDQMADP